MFTEQGKPLLLFWSWVCHSFRKLKLQLVTPWGGKKSGRNKDLVRFHLILALISLVYKGVELKHCAFDQWSSTWGRQARSKNPFIWPQFYFTAIQWGQYQISQLLVTPSTYVKTRNLTTQCQRKDFLVEIRPSLHSVATCPPHYEFSHRAAEMCKGRTVSEKGKISRYEKSRPSLCALMVSTLHLQEMNACSLQSLILFWFITI